MLIVPLRMDSAIEFRPFVSLIIGLSVLYQSIARAFFPELTILPDTMLMNGPETVTFWEAFLLSLARGPSPLAGFFVTAFWLVIGRGLEHKIGSGRLLAAYLIGSALMVPAGMLELVRFESGIWAGLGGTLVCLGMAYTVVWDEDVTFFYLVLTPIHISAGFSTTAAFFVTIPIQLILAATQIRVYSHGEVAPEGLLGAPFFAFIAPIAVALVLVLARLTATAVRGRPSGGLKPAR